MAWVTRWKLVDEASAPFVRGAQRMSDGMKSLERNAFGTSGILGKLGTVAAGVFTVAAVKRIIDYGDSLYTLSQRSGLSVRMLSALGTSAEQAGASLESVGNASRFLARAAYEAATAGGIYADAFKSIGIEVKTLAGLSPDELFIRTSRALAGVADQGTKTAAAMELFGRSGVELIPLVGEMDAVQAEAAALGTGMDDFAKQADAFNDSIAALNKSLILLASAGLTDALGSLAGMIEKLATALRGIEPTKLDMILKGAATGAITGGALGIGTGPGALLSAAGGAVVGGVAGAGLGEARYYYETHRAAADLERMALAPAGTDPRAAVAQSLFRPMGTAMQPEGGTLEIYPDNVDIITPYGRQVLIGAAGAGAPAPAFTQVPRELGYQGTPMPFGPMEVPGPLELSEETQQYFREQEDALAAAAAQAEQLEAIFAGGLRQAVGSVVQSIWDAFRGMQSWEDAALALADIFADIVQKIMIAAAQQAILAAIGLESGGVVPGFAGGGVAGAVPWQYLALGGASRGTDTVPAMLTPGEGILTRDTTRRLGGRRGIEALNRGGGAGGGTTVNQTFQVGTLLGSNGLRELAAAVHPHTAHLIRRRGYEGLA